MKRLVVGLVLVAVMFAPMMSVVAQGQATVLDPISPLDVVPWHAPVVIAPDGAGRVMVVYMGKREGTPVMASSLLQGGQWSGAEVPLPADVSQWSSAGDMDLAGRDGQFVLLFSQRGTRYYALWSGNSWSVPTAFSSTTAPHEISFDAQGNAIAWQWGTKSYFYRQSGETWQSVQLPRHEKQSWEAPAHRMTVDRNGAVHVLGETMYDVITLASCPAGADPLQADSWVFQPPFDREHTTPLRNPTKYYHQ